MQPKVKYTGSAFFVRPGQTINFQPGSKAFEVVAAKHVLTDTGHIRIDTACGETFFLRIGEKIHISQPATHMLLVDEPNPYASHKHLEEIPAVAYPTPSYVEPLLFFTNDHGTGTIGKNNDLFYHIEKASAGAGKAEILEVLHA